jgi:hypothetical protein|tara:strand:- start:2571 stop:3338 length:768 start_codon:yes stop_codon:yes gene_type:complete
MSRRKCGICGEAGHDARNCTETKDEVQSDEGEDRPVKAKSEATLVRALHAAQWEANRIDKDSKNTFSNYDYTSAESMMSMWTEISGRHGLSLFPVELNIRYSPGDPPILQTTWVLSHVRGEDRTLSMEWPVVTGKGKPMDKAIASARTSSLGYLIRDLLIAPRIHPTDDMDHTRWSEPQRDAKPKKPSAPKKSDIEHFWDAIDSYGYTKDQINGYFTMRGGRLPPQMDRREHVKILEWLIEPKGREALKNFINQQ